ncbi:carbohydrate ABC transporter ATP-binding protein, CUT1 family [Palleronia marisminoris]|uniref:Maltose/maltodextrin import ATP-binding protein MalK n=1 Tax=Palleronia marisminoris TaxID=315423 RepID=A0A1Y5RZZ1_9RHOB|nr:sn-glycerol-3-phosphate ABC transporter ATP-binding protein UgpC [Palleronia marisminoris]SFG39090.1 carbohydrate ABC transporter ATP-binding protein, CUT1 family [Palleronia marisminoris]SLN29573.1 Maltose/maltodextrin import ATP-binding protein MalK [Palleronia marisminoris]
MAELELRDVRKSYGRIDVLHDIDLKIEDGEFVVLVGPSGCGKSTLLRMIAGLEPISGGDFLIGGKQMNDVPPRDRDIAMVFQSYALYPHMAVDRNMGFSMEIRRKPAAERKGPVTRAARTLGLEPYLDRFPKALSGGQRQRVAMGRAIVRDPKAFLFDEPLSNLDAALRVEMRLEIARLHQRLGTTMVYVTHDQVEAMTLADRIVVLNAGEIQQIGTPLELYEAPANRFVAQFIGSPTMNVLELPPEGGLKLDSGARIAGTGGARHLGMRPEHLRIVPAGQGDITVEAQVIERLGSDTNIYTEAAHLGPLLVRAHGNVDLRSGERCGLIFDREKLHLFDQEGARITPNAAAPVQG